MTKTMVIGNKKAVKKINKEMSATSAMSQYKVEIFNHNCWCHVAWRKNELSSQVMADVLKNSRKKSTRVIFEGKIIHSYEAKNGRNK
jgi:hypothetical protein